MSGRGYKSISGSEYKVMSGRVFKDMSGCGYIYNSNVLL